MVEMVGNHRKGVVSWEWWLKWWELWVMVGHRGWERRAMVGMVGKGG